MTIFSVPYYSSLSLLPTDPSPYTLPNASTKRSEQPPITLANYPLPDGNWQWISRSWMIDMGANTGAVQHDGFEYNWSFRNHAWRAQVGVLSAGGWVRRRRWVRLMMCPAKLHIKLGVSGLTPASSNDNVNASKHQSRGSSIPPSVNTGFSGSEINWDDLGLGSVWVGEDVGANWERCHHVLKKLGRDGRKLEVWRIWLGFYHPDHQDSFTEVNDEGKRRGKQWTEDESSEHAAQDGSFFKSIVPPSKEMIVGVIREHVRRSSITLSSLLTLSFTGVYCYPFLRLSRISCTILQAPGSGWTLIRFKQLPWKWIWQFRGRFLELYQWAGGHYSG